METVTNKGDTMAKKARATEVERFIERLPVRLTIEEIAAYADMAARTRAEADLREADRALRNKLEREAIEGLEAEMREHLRKVREKREDRDVECEERMVFASNTVADFERPLKA